MVSVMRTFVLAMVLHPQVMKKAQAELDQVVGSDRLPDWDDREALPYLQCLIKEIYRCVLKITSLRFLSISMHVTQVERTRPVR